MKRIVVLAFAVGVLWTGCAFSDDAFVLLGTIRVQDGLVSAVFGEAIPLAVGDAAPERLFERDVLSGNYAIDIWQGECTGTGRLRHCDGGIQFVDTDSPERAILSTYETPQIATDVALEGHHAYVTWRAADTLGPGGLVILDVSDPAAPVEMGSFITLDWVLGLALDFPYAYLVTRGAIGTHGLEILDISDPGGPTPAGFFERESGMPVKAAVLANHLFLIWGEPCFVPSYPLDCDHSLRVLNIAHPVAPLEISVRDLPDPDEAYVWPDGGHALVLIDGLLYVPLDDAEWAVFRAGEFE